MLRATTLPTLLLVSAVAVGAGCQKRLATTDYERTCRSLVRCWYPDDEETSFDPDSARWGSMAEPSNIQHIRHAYGETGSCWYADPMTGTMSDGARVSEDAQAVGCGAACACAILELCFARDDVDASPECVGASESNADPCEDDWYPDFYAELCPSCEFDADEPDAGVPGYCCQEDPATPDAGVHAACPNGQE